MCNKENENNTRLSYYITRLHDDGEYYLECITGANRDWAEKVLAEHQAKEPTATFRLEADKIENCWWRDGTN